MNWIREGPGGGRPAASLLAVKARVLAGTIAAVVAVCLVAGCDGSASVTVDVTEQPNAAGASLAPGPPPATPTSSGAQAPGVAATTAGLPAQSTDPAPPPPATGPTTPARPCHGSDLRVSVGPGSTPRPPTVTTGYQWTSDLTVFTVSTTPCTLGPWFTVALQGRHTVTRCAPPLESAVCGVNDDYTVARGQSVEHLAVGSAQTQVLGDVKRLALGVTWSGPLQEGAPATCVPGPDPDPAWQLELRLPDSGEVIGDAIFRYSVCGGRLGITPLGVTA